MIKKEERFSIMRRGSQDNDYYNTNDEKFYNSSWERTNDKREYLQMLMDNDKEMFEGCVIEENELLNELEELKMNEQVNELRKEIKRTELNIASKEDEIEQFDKYDYESDFEESYDDMLDDSYPEVFNILPSRILRECDPIAYNEGLTNYIDSLELTDFGVYNELADELEYLVHLLKCLKEELNNLREA